MHVTVAQALSLSLSLSHVPSHPRRGYVGSCLRGVELSPVSTKSGCLVSQALVIQPLFQAWFITLHHYWHEMIARQFI